CLPRFQCQRESQTPAPRTRPKNLGRGLFSLENRGCLGACHQRKEIAPRLDGTAEPLHRTLRLSSTRIPDRSTRSEGPRRFQKSLQRALLACRNRARSYSPTGELRCL